MTFTSAWFFPFAAFVVAFYYVSPQKRRWLVLFVASIMFCLVGGWQVLAVAVLAGVVAYGGAIVIGGTEGKERRKRRAIATAVSVVLLGVLVFYKLAAFFEWGYGSILLPVGISYYTFSIVGYVMDVYWGKEQAETNLAKFLLFVLFFPKILMGPIARYRDLAPQLSEGHRFEWEQFCYGMQLALWGYFKKVVIADRIGIYTSQVFSQISELGGVC